MRLFSTKDGYSSNMPPRFPVLGNSLLFHMSAHEYFCTRVWSSCLLCGLAALCVVQWLHACPLVCMFQTMSSSIFYSRSPCLILCPQEDSLCLSKLLNNCLFASTSLREFFFIYIVKYLARFLQYTQTKHKRHNNKSSVALYSQIVGDHKMAIHKVPRHIWDGVWDLGGGHEKVNLRTSWFYPRENSSIVIVCT